MVGEKYQPVGYNIIMFKLFKEIVQQIDPTKICSTQTTRGARSVIIGEVNRDYKLAQTDRYKTRGTPDGAIAQTNGVN